MKQARSPRLVDEVSDSEDEEISEDEAFNSEDERKYGAFFKSKKETSSPSDTDSNSDSDENDEDGDGGQYMLDLLDKLDSSNGVENENTTNDGLTSHVKESEFAAAVVRGANLTLDSLMDGLEDTKGFGVMQRTFKELSKGKATDAPVSKVVSERARRQVQYADQSKEISLWLDAVQENRKAETLDFVRRERVDVLTKDRLVDKFVPTTDFEKELQDALKAAGQEDEQAILKREEELAGGDDLGSKQLSLEEYQRRRGELAKMRALLFYHEQKRHHINKIKSKKYRRIRKKQRERLKEAEMSAQMEQDPDLARELEEKEEIERMKERMTLAHKNTSKWARRVLKRGKNVDVNTRRALSAQLQRGEDLRKKMNAAADDAEDDGESDDEDLVDTARKVLTSTEDEQNDQPSGKTGLFKLSFMQRGVEKQRERAKQEARQLLQELEANEREDKSEHEEDFSEQKQHKKKKKKKVASAAEMKSVLGDNKFVANALQLGKSSAVEMRGGIEIDVGDKPSTPGLTSKTAGHSNYESTMSVAPSEIETTSGELDSQDAIDNKVGRVTSTKAKTTAQKEGKEGAGEEANPWLAATDDVKSPSPQPQKKQKRKRTGVKKNGIVDVGGAANLLAPSEESEKRKGHDGETAPTDSTAIAELSQEELVRRAFAGPSEAEMEEEFAKEKAEAEERDNEDPTRKKKALVPRVSTGWGCWAGEGAPAPKPPRRLPKKLQPPPAKQKKRRRKDEKLPLVIINEKRVKSTASKFQIAQIPYPFGSREEYERAMTGALGKEWNVSSSVRDNTRPEILNRAGKIIQPISTKVKRPRPAAKF